MIKYYCDGCGKELPESYCLYTLGHILCDFCLPKFTEKYTKNGILVLPHPNEKLDLFVDVELL